MNITFDVMVFVIGCAGAFAHESLRWIGLRTEERLPAYLCKLHYWLLTIILVLLGGTLSTLLAPTTAVQALWFGIAAPSILSRLGSLVPDEETLGPETKIARTSLRDFLRG